MKSVRNISEYKSNRTRECWHCEGKINKGDTYIRKEIRYDKTIISQYFHKSNSCFQASLDNPKVKPSVS